jgi:membrane associated rhomboid family serine protease
MTIWIRWKRDFKLVIGFVVLLWIIHSAEALFHWHLRSLAIYPGKLEGLMGIIFAPLLHSSWEHLSANTLPSLFLGGLLVYGYPCSKWKVVAMAWLISGLGVWLWGRPSFHLGASGVNTGIFYFLFAMGILRRDKRSLALMFLAVFMYGGMLLGVLPWDPQISYEAHLFGGVGGLVAATLFRNSDPKPPEKKYDWEIEDDLDDDNDYWNVR